MARSIRIPFAFLLLWGAVGCGPQVVLRRPAGWATARYGRGLYNTPNAFIYASSDGPAGEIDRMIIETAVEFSSRTGRNATKGVVFVNDEDDLALAPDDESLSWLGLDEAVRTMSEIEMQYVAFKADLLKRKQELEDKRKRSVSKRLSESERKEAEELRKYEEKLKRLDEKIKATKQRIQGLGFERDSEDTAQADVQDLESSTAGPSDFERREKIAKDAAQEWRTKGWDMKIEDSREFSEGLPLLLCHCPTSDLKSVHWVAVLPTKKAIQSVALDRVMDRGGALFVVFDVATFGMAGAMRTLQEDFTARRTDERKELLFKIWTRDQPDWSDAEKEKRIAAYRELLEERRSRK